MKNRIQAVIYLVATWILISVSMWVTVRLLNLTSTNQFTGKMKSFELEFDNAFAAGLSILVSFALIKETLRRVKK